MAGAAIPGVGGAVAGTGVSSVHADEGAAVWIVGLRYKILDANTGEQKATNYIEDKMEINSKGGGAFGVSQSETRIVTLDTMSTPTSSTQTDWPSRNRRPVRSPMSSWRSGMNL